MPIMFSARPYFQLRARPAARFGTADTQAKESPGRAGAQERRRTVQRNSRPSRKARIATDLNGVGNKWRSDGVRPWSWTGSRGGFDPLPGVVILELRGAQVAERGVQPAGVVDLVNEAGKIRGDVLERFVVHQVAARPRCTEARAGQT